MVQLLTTPTSLGLISVGTALSLLLVTYVTRKREKADEFSDRETSSASEIPLKEIYLGQCMNEPSKRRILMKGSISIVHGSMTGTARRLAHKVFDELPGNEDVKQIGCIEEWDWWDELLNDEDDTGNESKPATLIVILPTYTEGSWPPCALNLEKALQEVGNDWRIAKFPLKNKLQVAILGLGSSAYDNMGQPAREAVRSFQKLGAKCLVRLAVGDDAVGQHLDDTFKSWLNDVHKQMAPSSCGCTSSLGDEDCCKTPHNPHDKSTVTSVVDEDDEYSSDEDNDEDGYSDGVEPDVIDLEDMGDAILASGVNVEPSREPREMVTPSQAKALTKEGYKLIGTHSAVKLCRWTKHQLRGRGGCYKHTFYGITSYQCMEATPSLACANKCVFCWRHHKNPVGREWRWKTDEPDFIVDEAVKTHIQMIKETKGIPGVRMDRWKEAHTVRHCALSLVGEPIMYPKINDLLGELHKRHISTYLVTNGQHPQAIESLRPITQLYVSVDAPTKESLIAIDRPLFNDAWERLGLSLKSLKKKGQRTVARLTVVKGWNSDEIGGYAELIALGHVSLVEVKGVTFCGKSDASNLNMTNSPYHHEIVDLVKTLKQALDRMRLADPSLPEYEIACEHIHSVSVLLARTDQFTSVDPSTGKRTWRTWVDYDKFQELAAKHDQDPTFTFDVKDYTAETPSWALFGAQEEGFDPTETRHRRKQKYPKYTKFDDKGVPTHNHLGEVMTDEERSKLTDEMDSRIQALGASTVVTEMRDGAKLIEDPSLMYRGLTVSM